MKSPDTHPNALANATINRRRFMAGAGAAALSFTIMPSELAFGSRANSRITLGLVGCGVRGTWIANLFKEHGGYEIVTVADYFQDRVDTCGDRFSVPANQRFTGLSAYKQLIESDIDAVAIESPPYFHPEQAAAAVDAGRHVYLAKPIAVDVPGCRSVEESGKKAAANNLCFLIDFQTRTSELFQEAIQRVHQGALGTIAFGESDYQAENPWKSQVAYLEDNPNDPENRLRAWGMSRALSGDIITEQNIHTLDVASWIMQTPPRYAYGMGGRKVRQLGDCWDHFMVLFQYPDDIGISFTSRQFDGYGTNEGITNRMFGSEGVLETNYFGEVIIRGEKPYPGGKTQNLYTSGAATNIATFHRDVTEGRYENPTLQPSVQSNRLTILGRMAAYENREVTWDEMMASEERLTPDLEGLRA